ncbi:MAG: hypothetical protein ACI9NN_001468, partial [Bacteroidia bacterium]
MYKFILTSLIIIQLPSLVHSQSNELKAYQSAENSYYWKNRAPNAAYWQQDVHYKIDAKIDENEETITATEELVYWNNSPDTLTKIYFHLYQNAFTPNSYLHNMRTQDKVKSTFGVYELKGEGTSIKSLKVNGVTGNFTIDNTLMWIDLDQPVLPNSGVKISIDFVTFWDKDDGGNIRRRMKSFRHGGADDKQFLHLDGVHWYPRVSVYDRKFGWTTDQHLGKEFYGDYGVFEISLSFPNHFVVEATGELQNPGEMYPGDLRERLDISNYKTTRSEPTTPVVADGSFKKWRFTAINVHDFAFTADPSYRIGEVVWNGIKCIALAQEENAHRWQPTAKFVAEVVRIYSEDIGMFAYPKMIAADARDGMEYPMLTLNGGNWPGHRYVIAHEVGHNWFFGMVGNNETYRASMDEGFTQFLTAWSLKQVMGVKETPNSVDDGTVYYGYMNHAVNLNTAQLNIHSDHFNSAERHGGGYGQVYYKTATMLYNLQYVLGDELFLKAIQNYFNEWKMCHPYWEDFRTSIIQYTKVDLNWYFDHWIESKNTIDYKVTGIKKRKDKSYQIDFKRLGASMPLDVRVVDKNGVNWDYHIPNTYFVKETNARVAPKWTGWELINPTYTLNVEIPSGIKNVIIDPSGRLADVNRLNNSLNSKTHVYLDKLQNPSNSFRKYQLGLRPDVWYNAVDGIKVGLHAKGTYFQSKHNFEAGVWYNTGIEFSGTQESVVDNRDLMSYLATYQTRINPSVIFNANSRHIDGYGYHQVALTRETAKGRYVMDLGSNKRYNKDYPLYRVFTNSGFDNWMGLSYERSFKGMNTTSVLSTGIRATSLYSDYSYGTAKASLITHRPIKKMVLKTRLFAQAISGSNIAPESKLLLMGANTSEMMDNRYTRSLGWLSVHQVGFNKEGDYIQQGGGLNIRGYAGTAITNTNEKDSFFAFAGNYGASINAEL